MSDRPSIFSKPRPIPPKPPGEVDHGTIVTDVAIVNTNLSNGIAIMKFIAGAALVFVPLALAGFWHLSANMADMNARITAIEKRLDKVTVTAELPKRRAPSKDERHARN